MKSNKIIFLTPTMNAGGGERVVSEMSLNLTKNIEKIIVVFESIQDKTSYPYQGRLISLNLAISNNFFLKIYYFFLGFFKIWRIIIKEKPDHVMSFGGQLNIINILTNKKALVRVENFIPMSYSFKERIYGILIKILFNKAYKIIVVSKTIRSSLIENFGIKQEKIELIYNPIDIKKIQGLAIKPLEPKHQQIFNNSLVIINIGRMIEIKGQWCLIKAFKKVKDRIKEAKLVILGKGSLEKNLKNLIKNLNLENDVYFLGWQENPFKFLAKSKLFVLSSLGGEGLPCIILEAMACKVPIMSTDCKSGPREILAPKTDFKHETKEIEYAEYGILTPVCYGEFDSSNFLPNEKENIFSKALINVLNDKELLNKLKNKSEQRAEDFGIEKIIKKWDFSTKND
jgi:glycosyltransferase involved in cell wall biosynthesis